MNSISISTNYNLKWQLKNMPHYKVSECKNIINCKTGKVLKRTISGGYSSGYWIGKKFIPLKKLNDYCEKIITFDCPF